MREEIKMSDNLNDTNPSRDAEIDSRVAKLLVSGMSYEELAKYAAEGWSWSAFLEEAYESQQQFLGVYEDQLSILHDLLEKQISVTHQLGEISELKELAIGTRRLLEGQAEGRDAQRKIVARKGGEALHSIPGGSRDKRRLIQEAWASGKYTTRDICAEKECGALKMSYSTARKALRNTPEPPSRC